MLFFGKKKKICLQERDKVVVIFGGAGYVGRALLKEYSHRHDIFFVIVSKKNTVSGNNIISLREDATKNPGATVEKILSLVERVDIIVHAAAVYAFETADKMTSENMMKEFETNTVMPLLVTQEFLRQYWSRFTAEQNSNNKSKVIIIGSQAGNGKTNRPELITYSATKAALDVAWQYYQPFLLSKGVGSVFLKPGGLQGVKELDAFIDILKKEITPDQNI